MRIPSLPDVELGAIGCCLAGGLDTAIDAVEMIHPSAFYREDCQLAFGIIGDIAMQGGELNTGTFIRAWRAKHQFQIPAEILGASDNIPSASALKLFADDLMDCLKRRKLQSAAELISSKAGDMTVSADSIITEAEAALSGDETKSASVYSSKELTANFTDYLEARHQSKGRRSGLVTGFYKLDDYTDGLQLGEQTIIAARPSVGKTALAINFVDEICLNQKIPTLVVSLEMSSNSLLRRMLSSRSKIPLKSLRGGDFNEGDFERFTVFMGLIRKSPLHIVDGISGIDCDRLAAVIRRCCRKHGIKFVVVDYLQKIQASKRHEKRTYEVAQVSGMLKSMAVSTGAAFLTLAQLNRESEKDKGRTPRLADLADSGQIERDADTVGLLHRIRTEQDPNGSESKLLIAKQRDGEVGCVDLFYDGQYCQFNNPRMKEE